MNLAPVRVPDETVWNAGMNATFHTGDNAVTACLSMKGTPDVALDIETPSVTDSFTIKCVTAAWVQDGVTHAVLLDPSRHPAHVAAVHRICGRARHLILHNSPFDVPGLAAADLLPLAWISKIFDTLVLARMALPDTMDRKSLEALAKRYLGLTGLSDGLKLAQKAAGFTSAEKWFRHGDIHIPTYRHGALADTVVTLRLAELLFDAAVDRQLDHPFTVYGCTTRSEAAELVMIPQRANRIMLRRAAVGLAVDTDYQDRYVDSVECERIAAERILTDMGLRPGVGLDIIKALDADGALPANWPRTDKGTLKSDKASMELLPDHPLAMAHRTVAHTRKVLGYMEKVTARSRVTGRLHPQWNILGASATGRMSASEPELQQFPEEARPIIIHEPGLSSVDWSSIEPALLGWMSQDWEFIDPFEAGADIYEPVMLAAGCTRKTSKVVVLAGMYGQATRRLAATLGCSLDQAAELQRQMRAAMPKASRYMGKIKSIAEQYGLTLTVAGRVLPVPSFNGVVAVHKSVNFTIQGSCADLMYESIIRAEEAGVGDELFLSMHDEIVCGTVAAEEIQRIMSTPPRRLIERAGGRVPVIRTDREDLGRSWIKC